MGNKILVNAAVKAASSGEGKCLRPSRGVFQADVYLVDVAGQSYILKDFRKRPLLARLLICRAMIRHEIKMLRHFADSGYVPEVFGRFGRDAFVMEYLTGEHPGEQVRGKWPQAFDATAAFLDYFHREGFAHNDFRRTNLLIQPDGSVRFFDFVSALRKPRGLFGWILFPYTWLLGVMQKADRNSLMKMKFDITGKPLTAEEIKQIKKPKWIRVLQHIWNHGINGPILQRFK